MIYRVEAALTDNGPERVARVRIRDVAGWGVKTSLDQEFMNFLEEDANPSREPLTSLPSTALPSATLRAGRTGRASRERAVVSEFQGAVISDSKASGNPPAWRRIPVTEIQLENGPKFWRRFGLLRRLRAAGQAAVGRVAKWMGRYSFLIFFLAAYLVAQAFNLVMDAAFWASPEFAIQFFRFYWATIPLTVVLEFGLITYLFVVAIPTLIDNGYRHLNRADNLMSLKRAPRAVNSD